MPISPPCTSVKRVGKDLELENWLERTRITTGNNNNKKSVFTMQVTGLESPVNRDLGSQRLWVYWRRNWERTGKDDSELNGMTFQKHCPLPKMFLYVCPIRKLVFVSHRKTRGPVSVRQGERDRIKGKNKGVTYVRDPFPFLPLGIKYRRNRNMTKSRSVCSLQWVSRMTTV